MPRSVRICGEREKGGGKEKDATNEEEGKAEHHARDLEDVSWNFNLILSLPSFSPGPDSRIEHSKELPLGDLS